MFPILASRLSRPLALQCCIRAHRDRLDGGTKWAAGQVLCNTLATTGACRNTGACRGDFLPISSSGLMGVAHRDYVAELISTGARAGAPEPNGEWSASRDDYAAPAMYRANRPHARQRSVTWQRGGGGKSVGVRSIWPEQDGQLSGDPVRSLAIRWSACAGLNVAGLGLRISTTSRLQLIPETTAPVRLVTANPLSP